MRLSLLSGFCFFFLYIVSASPVPQRHAIGTVSTTPSLALAAPTGPAQVPVKVPIKFQPLARPLDGRTPTIHVLPKKLTKPSHCVKKRADNPVEEALHDRTTMVGSGNTGIVFKTRFKGKDAVVKVIDTKAPGGQPEAVKKEVTNLLTVEQLLGWGEKKTEKGHFFYVVMPNMGVLSETTGLSYEQLRELGKEAEERYLDIYHMENRDKNANNYVYRHVNGQWQAEIIDWARATYTGTTPQPDPGNPQQITDSAKCNVM